MNAKKYFVNNTEFNYFFIFDGKLYVFFVLFLALCFSASHCKFEKKPKQNNESHTVHSSAQPRASLHEQNISNNKIVLFY